MWKKRLLTLGMMAMLPLYGQNLIVNGDFNESPANLLPECRSNGGTIALFTEDLTWNKCGQLKVDKIKKTQEGTDIVGCTVWIGGGENNRDNAMPGGFECKPDTVYQFSLDIKGTAPEATVAAMEWKTGATLWNSKSFRTSVGNITVQKDWTRYKGTFKTGSDSVRAALCLMLWWDTKYGAMKYKIDDYILFDNVVVTEQKENPLTSSAPAAPAATLKTTKTISTTGGAFSDFVTFKDNGTPAAETAVEVSSDKNGIILSIDCREPLKVTPATKGLWSGDVVEIFFGAKSGDRRVNQFVVGPDGTKFSGRGDSTDIKADWEAKTSVTEGGWHADVRIPFSSLGWKNPENGESIAFNVARERKVANERQTWSEVKSSFHDVEYFGSLLLGPYPDGLTRSQYEKAQAEKEAARLKEKFEKNSKKTLLAAPVRITDDFSVPFLPEAVFDAPEKIELKAAVNELKPLALAIANLTAKPAEYRVVVESKPVNAKAVWGDGQPFPGVTLRQGVRMRDSGKADGALFEPLPRLNEASSMLVPPKEAGLLWIDFDTAGMKPGNFEGRIRIIPLNGKAVFTQAGYGYGNFSYSGEMTDVPFSLHVRNIELSKEPSIPGDFFSPSGNSEVVKLLTEAGMRVFLINPWSLHFPLDKEGKLQPEAPQAMENLNKLSGLSEKKFFIGFQCYNNFLKLYNNKAELWPEWLATLKKFLEKNGIDLKNCYAEIYDEPDPKNFDEILRVMVATKKLAPEMKLTITLGAHIMSAEQMEKLHPYVDCWYLWSHGYFTRPEHLAFIRKAQAEGREIGHYTCDTHLRSPLDRNYRRNAWFGEYHKLDTNALFVGITGLLQCIWKKTPEGEVVYHGLDYAVPSVRYMALRQGMTDVKYLAKLREVGKNSPEAQEFLKNAAKRVVVDFGHDPDTADKVREEAAELILKLQGEK